MKFRDSIILLLLLISQSNVCLGKEEIDDAKYTKWKHLNEKAIQYFYDRSYGKSESTLIKALAEIRELKQDSNEELATLARLVDVCLKRRNCTKAHRYLESLTTLYLKKIS